MSAIKIGDPSDPHQFERLVMAVAQNLCCESGCAVDGAGCKAASFRSEARRQLLEAPIVYVGDGGQ